MAHTKRGGQGCHHAKYGRDRRQLDLAAEFVLQSLNFLTHRAAVADDAARPIEHTLTLGRKALETRTALHQHYAKDFLKLFDTGRHRWLSDATDLRRPAEMPLLR